MSYLQALLLGILQGITEFFPVSSSGHLVLVPWLLGWADPGLTYDAFLHLGTALAIVGFFWRDILALMGAWFASLRARRVNTAYARVAWLIVLSTLPAALLGLFLDDLFERLFSAPRIVALLLLVTGVLLVVSEQLGRRQKAMAGMNSADALAIGVAQGLAIAPGISRSGATIAAGLARGLERAEAARFSFLIALPTIVGAGGVQLFRLLNGAEQAATPGVAQVLIGFLAALASGVLAIRFLLNYLLLRGLRPFAIYCWIAGIACLALTFLR